MARAALRRARHASSATTARSRVADLIEQVIEETAEDAEALGCLSEMQPLPHHRRRRHLGGRADRGVRDPRQDRRPRPRAAGGQGLARGRDAAVAAQALAFGRQRRSAPPGRGRAHRPRRARAARTASASAPPRAPWPDRRRRPAPAARSALRAARRSAPAPPAPHPCSGRWPPSIAALDAAPRTRSASALR